MSENRFDVMRRQIEVTRRVVENSDIAFSSPDCDLLLALKASVYTLMDIVIELADEAERTVEAQAEGRSIAA